MTAERFKYYDKQINSIENFKYKFWSVMKFVCAGFVFSLGSQFLNPYIEDAKQKNLHEKISIFFTFVFGVAGVLMLIAGNGFGARIASDEKNIKRSVNQDNYLNQMQRKILLKKLYGEDISQLLQINN